MVRRVKDGQETVFYCERCGFGYADIETAESCETYCSTHNSCSLSITSKAIRVPD